MKQVLNYLRDGGWLPVTWFTIGTIVLATCLLCGQSAHSTPSQTNAAAVPSAAKYITKSIEDIRPGDLVLSRDEHGNAIEMKRVVETYRRVSDHLRILTFEDEARTSQTLKTTDEHPFWVVGRKKFVDARNLVVGNVFLGPQGEHQRLVSTMRESHPGRRCRLQLSSRRLSHVLRNGE